MIPDINMLIGGFILGTTTATIITHYCYRRYIIHLEKLIYDLYNKIAEKSQ